MAGQNYITISQLAKLFGLSRIPDYSVRFPNMLENGQETLKTAFLTLQQLPPRGVELLEGESQTPIKKALTKNPNSALSTGLDNSLREYPDLAEVAQAWPDLSE